MSDSPRVGDQAPLTSASGRAWLAYGGVIAAVALFMLVLMRELRPLGASAVGIATTLVLYLAMVVVQFATGQGRVRLYLHAFLTIALVVGFLVVGSVITLTELTAEPLRGY
jgi:hypothetical protein